jgi:hypothetical protein
LFVKDDTLEHIIERLVVLLQVNVVVYIHLNKDSHCSISCSTQFTGWMFRDDYQHSGIFTFLKFLSTIQSVGVSDISDILLRYPNFNP